MRLGCQLIVLVLAASTFADDAPLPPFFLAKETTYFSGPLRRDGTVDYIAAINEQLGRGVTPENNAAIPLLKAVVAGIQPTEQPVHYARLWTKLGVADAPKPGTDDAGPANPDALDETGKGPWTAARSPDTAKYLEASSARLDLLIAASLKPRCCLPLIREREDDFLVAVLLPHLNHLRGLANALRSRAMLRLGNEDTAGFVADATALVRVGRLLTQSPTLIEKMVAMGIEIKGLEALRIAATGGWLSEKQARDLLAEVDTAAPLSRTVFDSFGLERTFILEFLQFAAIHGTADAEKMFQMFAGNANAQAPMLPVVAGAAKDWNAALRKSNAWYDRITAIEKEPTFAARQRAARAILKDMEALKSSNEGWKGVLAPLEDRAIVLLLPVIERVVIRQTNIEAEREVTRTTLALTAYRSKNGKYPTELKELSPTYVRTTPLDPFTAKELVYRPTTDGYTLLSVGPDGLEQPPRGTSDDIAVRVGN